MTNPAVGSVIGTERSTKKRPDLADERWFVPRWIDLEELMTEMWATHELLASAVQRYSSGIPGLVMPVAYSVGRLDGETVASAT